MTNTPYRLTLPDYHRRVRRTVLSTAVIPSKTNLIMSQINRREIRFYDIILVIKYRRLAIRKDDLMI